MSIKSNKQSRGLFLRGAMGSTLAIPFLESIAQAKPNSPSKKCAFFYVPIGVVRNTFFPGESDVAVKDFNSPNNKAYQGAEMKVGWHSFPQTPTLKPLNKLKNKVTLVTNLDRTFQDGTDVHAQCASCFLSSAAHTPSNSRLGP